MPFARFWRVRVDTAGGSVSCVELRLFSHNGATVEVLGGTATANSNPTGWYPVDLTIDFGAGNEQSIRAFSWQARNDGYHN